MLQLNDIVKVYTSGDGEVHALRGVSLEFRKNEFVSILGQSGCGKTTLLNIIGGLDRYTSGDLVINKKSTKTFNDSDWDTYRNHSVGFVFQSYNLIPHQTVLANVELALTLSGVSKAERRKRAIEALAMVGLSDQINKKPTQMSGGQMQRVAIARALVNNPDILLADEPTGALDTSTSVQIMEILKEVAKDRLVIMVTHNPELAEQYSTRIVRLSDGAVISDTNPYDSKTEVGESQKAAAASEKKPKMSFATALSLSLNNLITKKGRTIITAFAGSIGIIGIALILSMSNGIQLFINQVQEDTLSTYPLTIQKETQDMASMLSAMTSTGTSNEDFDEDKIYVDDSLGTMMQAMSSTVSNDLVSFREYLEANRGKVDHLVSDIQYTYDLDLQVYNLQHGPTKLGMANLLGNMGDQFSGVSELMASSGSGMDVMSEMINNRELLDQQYELVDGKWPEEANEVVIVVSKNNQISKLTLYMLGMLDQSELEEVMGDLMQDGEYDTTPMEPYDVEDFLELQFYMLNTYDFYQKTDKTYGDGFPVWNDIRDDVEYKSEDGKLSEFITENGMLLKVSGVIRPRAGATSTSISGVIGYTKELTDLLLENNANSEVINQQKKTPDTNVLTGLPFERTKYTPETIDQLIDKIDDATMEQFYAYMTKLILENPEFASRLDVKDKESFMQVFFLMPKTNQAQIVEGILASANAQNSMGVTMLTSAITQMMNNGVTVTPENIMVLYDILELQHIAVLLGGIPQSEAMPVAVSGIIDLAGEQTMSEIYTQTSTSLKQMTVTEEIFLALLGSMNAEDEDFITLEESLYKFAPQTDATLESNLKLLGDAEKASPASVNFYAKDFESKDEIEKFIADYNAQLPEGENELKYTDLVGALMSSITIILDVISGVLIGFVAISLVVSSVMIGIITNISVLERTKEIGILRAIGASKKDVSRVFNAETFIIGTCSGILGILITIILCLIANLVLSLIPGIPNVRAVLPPLGAIILILISMGLTLIAGLIPSRKAAKMDPVEALRSE